MNLTQLHTLFDELPEGITEHLGEGDLQTCWYGSAGLDHRFVDMVNGQGPIPTQLKPKVFFYTDPAYTDSTYNPNPLFSYQHPDGFCYNGGNGEKTPWTYLKEISFKPLVGESKEAWIYCYNKSWLGFQYIILIDCPNQLLEITLIQKQLKIEFVCERGSYGGGEPPLLLGDLGALWSLGDVPETYDEEHKNRLLYYFRDELKKAEKNAQKKAETREREKREAWASLTKDEQTEIILKGLREKQAKRKLGIKDIPERGNEILSDEFNHLNQPLEIKGIPYVGIGFKGSLNYGGCRYPEGYLPLRKILYPEKNGVQVVLEIPQKYCRHIRTLNVETARWLCDIKKIDLSGLQNITPEIAHALSAHDGLLKLDGVKELTVDVASEISTHKGVISLTGLRDLSLESANALLDHHGTLRLSPRLSISSEVAEVLAEHKGPISFRAEGKRTIFSKLDAPHAKLLRRAYEGFAIYIQASWNVRPYAIPILARHPDGLILTDATRHFFDGQQVRDRTEELRLRSKKTH